jgi:hypothetical protein
MNRVSGIWNRESCIRHPASSIYKKEELPGNRQLFKRYVIGLVTMLLPFKRRNVDNIMCRYFTGKPPLKHTPNQSGHLSGLTDFIRKRRLFYR